MVICALQKQFIISDAYLSARFCLPSMYVTLQHQNDLGISRTGGNNWLSVAIYYHLERVKAS